MVTALGRLDLDDGAVLHRSTRTAPVVELLHWPAEADRRELLRREGRPRLLLVAPACVPPGLADHEDWVLLPVDERDLSARLQRLAGHARAGSTLVAGEIEVHDGTVRWRGREVAVTPKEAALVTRLAATPDRLVRRGELMDIVWGQAPRRPHSLDSRIHALRARLRPLGLALCTVRGRGFVLTKDAVDDDGPALSPSIRSAP